MSAELNEAFNKPVRDWLLVSEMFHSHQGEGPSSGELATFLRLGGCNLHCSWCDTPYTWVYTERQRALHRDGKLYEPQRELKRKPILRLANELRKYPGELIVITGGEPMLQQPGISLLVSAINEELPHKRFEIETAGTIAPTDLTMFENVRYNVSLKLQSSGNELELRRVPSAIHRLREEMSIFKFVITQLDDVIEILDIVRDYEIAPERIWLMPQGVTQLDIVSGLQRVTPLALRHGFNVSSRLHVLAYGNERGT